jgi:hypothetical protein
MLMNKGKTHNERLQQTFMIKKKIHTEQMKNKVTST